MKRSASGCGEFSSTPASNACATIAGAIGSLRSSASSSPRPRTPPRPCRAETFCSSLSSNRPASATDFRNSGLADLLEHRKTRRAHQRIAVERAALVAVLEAGGLFGREQRRQRHAAADALAERHDVGLDAGMLVVEELSGAAHAGLDLVDDQQQAVRLGQRAQLLQELIGRGPHAGFALDRLQHHRDGVVVDQLLRPRRVVQLRLREAGDLRLEQRLERLLARGRHRRERAAVEAAFEGDDLERAVLVQRCRICARA